MSATAGHEMKKIIDSASGLRNSLGENSGVHVLKLRALLQLAEEMGISNTYSAQLPPVEIGSISLVDQVILVILAKFLKPKTIIEIGTFKGFTTRLLVENTLPECKIFSIDLPNELINQIDDIEESLALASGSQNDNYLRKRQAIDGTPYLKGISKAQDERLSLVKHDSTRLDFRQAFGSAEMIFIDGGHERHIIESDTENALSIIERGVIVWHDFNSDLHGDVSSYLKEVSQNRAIFHVANSLIAFSLINQKLQP